MNAKKRRVTIADRATPVHLEPAEWELPSEEAVAAFEKQIGFVLPADYREFLLRYNGGYPVVGDVYGRDDDPNTPYAHGDAIRGFYGLGDDVPDYARLRPEAFAHWDMPANVLFIGDDAGGNQFALTLSGEPLVRFVDHEDPGAFEDQRVLATGFLDLLLRVRSLEEDARISAAEKVVARRALVEGPLPPAVAAQCDVIAAKVPKIRQLVRRVFLRVFDEKGFFAVHADEKSRRALDLVMWMAQASGSTKGMTSAEVQRQLSTTWSCPPGGLGFTGFAPGFVDEWWADRKSNGKFRMIGSRGHFTDEAAAEFVRSLERLLPKRR